MSPRRRATTVGRFGAPLVEARLIRRYKRFLADVRLADGRVVTVHCPNPGSMKSCLQPEGRVWLSRNDKPGRKLRYTWELAEVGRTRIYVNPAGANAVVAEGIESGTVGELQGYSSMQRETRIGRSRLDFVLQQDTKRCYVEVKNVTLGLGGGRSAFPDAVTRRGTRHLHELMELRRQGERAVLVFCAARSDARSVEPAVEIDPVYTQTLRAAAYCGVEVLAYRCRISRTSVRLMRPVPVLL